MDKIWNRNLSKLEVFGRCGGDEKKELPRRTDKSDCEYNKKIALVLCWKADFLNFVFLYWFSLIVLTVCTHS